MSYHPKFRSSNENHNQNNVVSTQENSVQFSLNEYVKKSSAYFDQDIHLKPDVRLVFAGRVQSNPFSIVDELNLAQSKSKTSAIQYDEANEKTTFSNTLDLSGASVLFRDESIPIAKIADLTSSLEGIQHTFSQFTDNDAKIVTHTNLLADHSSELSEHNAMLEENKSSITACHSALESEVKPDIAMLREASTVGVAERVDIVERLDECDILLSNHDTSIVALSSTSHQNEEDLRADRKAFVEYQTLNEVQKKDIQDDILKNTSDIGLAVGRVFVLEQNEVSNILTREQSDALIKGNIEEIEKTNVALTGVDTRLKMAEEIIPEHSGALTVLSGVANTHEGQLGKLETLTASHSALLSTHTDVVLLKQNAITSTTRLNVAFIGDGVVSNEQLNTLANSDPTTTIQQQLDDLKKGVAQSDLAIIQQNFEDIQSQLDAIVKRLP